MSFGLFSSKNPKNMSEKEYQKEISKMVNRASRCASKSDYTCASWAYQNASKIAEEREAYDDCIKHLLQAVEYSLKENRHFNVGWMYRLASNAAYHKGDFPNALEYAKQSADYFLKADSKYAAQWSYNMAAKICKNQGDIYSAIRFYRKSNRIIKDKDITEEIERLKRKIAHPIIEEYVDKNEVLEGEDIQFRVVVENTSNEPIRNVKLLDSGGGIVEEINELKPHEERFFTYNVTGYTGKLRPKYDMVTWENVLGDKFENKVIPTTVRVVPKISVITKLNPKLRFNKMSDFIILVRNESKYEIKDIKFDVDFPKEVSVKKMTRTAFQLLASQDEVGVVFSLTPKAAGRVVIRNVKIVYKDVYGSEYEELLEPIILEESVEQEAPRLTKDEISKRYGGPGLQKLKEIKEKKSKFDIAPNPISESEYLKLAEKFYSRQKGYTLDNIDMDTLVSYIVDELVTATEIAYKTPNNDRIMLFSGKHYDRTLLLTVVIKKEGNLVNLLFKLYSDKESGLDEVLNDLADIIRYTATIMGAAREVEKVEVNEVINIIDSVVQRSNIGAERCTGKKIKIKDSVVQRSNA